MKAVRLMSLAALVAVSLAPAALASGRKPGSVLFYPSVVTNVTGGHAIVTLVTVTNTNLDPVVFFTGTGGATAAHFEYVNATFNPLDPRNPPFASCNIVNKTPILTPADTLTVLTACDNGNSLATRLGYLVITAEDPALPAVPGTPWKHDFLIGSSMQIDFATGSSYAMNAIPFSAVDGVTHDHTERLPLNGHLDFDDSEYEQVPDKLYGDSVFTNLLPSLALINLEGGVNAINTIQMNMYDDNENPASVSFPFRCWFEWPLFLISDFFNPNTQFLSGIDNDQEVNLSCIGVPLNTPSPWNFVWFQVESINVQPNEFGGLPLASDGAVLGAITAGSGFPVGFPTPHQLSNGHLLWESTNPNEDDAGTDINGQFLEP